ncbi:MAG: DNA internalization-related competence protein ComEC/Rec2 [Lachnospiraceae bacterium]|nr:DNA internalization-related competence protein ComEC/Rec2 [Lachnospiraceae bacterium]
MILGSLFFSDLSDVSYIYLVIAIIFLVGLIIYEIQNNVKLLYIIISFLCMLSSYTLGSVFHYNYLLDKAYFDSVSDKENVTFQGELTAKEKKTASYYLYFNNIIIDDHPIDSRWTIILQSDSDNLSLGSTALINAEKVQFNIARNEGNFDEKSYYNSCGTLMKVKGSIMEYSEKDFSLQEALYQFRESIKEVLESNLPGEESGIMSAMCLGDKSNLDAEVKDMFKLSGLAHILAISGLHISIVGMGIYKLLRKRGMGYVVSGIISSILVILYGMLCDGGVSTIRAIGMFLIMILAEIIGRAYDILTAVAAMVIYVLILYPYCIDSLGFIFSFGTVTGISIFVSPLVSVYDKYIRIRFYERHNGDTFKISIKERIVKALLGGILIQIVTLPIVCYYYFEIPTYVVFLNAIIIPLLGVLLSVTLAGGVLGVAVLVGIFIIGNVLSIVSGLLLWISHIIIYVYEFLAYNSLKLPFARIITGRPSVIEIIIYYVIIFIISRFIIYRAKDMDKFLKRDYISLRNRVIAVSVGLLCLVLVITNNDNRLDFEMDVIDVGQGDGIYIGGGDINYFFDGGSTDVKNVGKYRILPFLKYKGIKGIEYWFVSHTDNDHISGLIEALEASYPIDYIVVDKYMLEEENFLTIKEKANDNNTEIIVMNKGDMVKEDDFSLRCIFSGDDSIDDINANSLVLVGEYTAEEPVSILLGGDMTAASEKIILSDESSNLSHIDILKVGHHGSKTSSSPEFIETIRPELSLISAGVNNSYGHPHDITLNTLSKIDSNILRTDEKGRLLVDLSAKKVLTFL